MIVVFIILVCFLLVIGIFIFNKLKQKKLKNKLLRKRFTCYFSTEEGEYRASGNKNDFTIISENKRFEYRVKNGKIVEIKDSVKSNSFKYYGDKK